MKGVLIRLGTSSMPRVRMPLMYGAGGAALSLAVASSAMAYAEEPPQAQEGDEPGELRKRMQRLVQWSNNVASTGKDMIEFVSKSVETSAEFINRRGVDTLAVLSITGGTHLTCRLLRVRGFKRFTLTSTALMLSFAYFFRDETLRFAHRVMNDPTTAKHDRSIWEGVRESAVRFGGRVMDWSYPGSQSARQNDSTNSRDGKTSSSTEQSEERSGQKSPSSANRDEMGRVWHHRGMAEHLGWEAAY